MSAPGRPPRAAALTLVACIATAASVDRAGKPAGPPAPEATDHPLVSSLRTSALAHLGRGPVPGIVFAVVENGSVVHVEGLGWANVKQRRPMTATTPINVGSISKSIAAWGIVRFCRREGLPLDTPVLPLVGSFVLPGTRSFDGAGVTVERVLSHSAGLSTPSAPVFPASRPLPSLAAILEDGAGGVPRLELLQPPGAWFSYSGGGFLLLQMMLEERSGESFSRFMAREILEPAGMAASSFRLTPALREAAATYYRSKGRPREPYHLPGAAGGLYSTAEDMGRWLTLYAEGSETRSRLLTAGEFRALLEARVPMSIQGVDTGGAAYGLGHALWRSPAGTLYAFHGGGNPGLQAFYFVAPETGNGLFLAANHDDGQRVFRDLIDAWARHYEMPPPPLF